MASIPFQPIDLTKPGLKRVRKPPKLKPMVRSVEIPMPVPDAPVRRKYTRDELKGDVQYLSQRLTTYLLEGNRLEQLMAKSSLKELSVMLGITTEKLLLLEGQPTQIISQQQHQKLDEVLPKLMEEMKRRGVKADLTERKVSLQLPPAGNM